MASDSSKYLVNAIHAQSRKQLLSRFSSLALLVLGVRADYHDLALAPDDFAPLTYFFDG
jgi:hypothetical protein